MNSTPATRAAPKRSAEDVFSGLVQQISTGQLRAGDRLPSEEQLAAQLDVAPMTLRQALAQLRELGFVETKRGRHGGTYVRADIAERLADASRNTRITASALRELTDWRRAISGESSYLAALRATDEDRAQLQRYSDEYHDKYLVPAERRLADARFHIFIAEITGNSRLVEAERDIQDTLSRILRVVPTNESNSTIYAADHRGLVDAIIAGNSEGARAELHDHIEVTYRWTVQQPSVTDDLSDDSKGIATTPRDPRGPTPQAP